MQVWKVLRAARWKYRTQKVAKNSPSGHHRTTLSGFMFATNAHIDNQKNLLNSSVSPTCPHNMVKFGLLAAEIRWRVWGTPANFNGFRVLAALIHGTLVVGVSQTLRRWTEGTIYIRHGGIKNVKNAFKLSLTAEPPFNNKTIDCIHCASKNVPPLQLAIIFTYTVRLRQFLA